MQITPATGSYLAQDSITIEPIRQDPPFTMYGLLPDAKDEAMKKALTALLLWEEMMPKTAARQIREEAIEALQKYV
jgi:hypothetical protein